MTIIDPSFTWLGNAPDGDQMLANIAAAGRVCYQSESKSDDAAFVRKRIKQEHESILEHEKISVRIICDRGVSHELVRHRIASYSQESTRYCNYSKGKFGSELTFIRPYWDDRSISAEMIRLRACWQEACLNAEWSYKKMIDAGCTPEAARAVLPNCLKTEVVMTANLREWRHFFKLRCAPAAHPDMRIIANMLLTAFKDVVPVVFDDIEGGQQHEEV
jgi:thymidylate synthase (FAD)